MIFDEKIPQPVVCEKKVSVTAADLISLRKGWWDM
jgi:hypothetical protein